MKKTPLKTPLERAIEILGSQSALARALDVKPQSVQQWLAAGQVPTKRIRAIELATSGKVKRHELRPDIFGDAA